MVAQPPPKAIPGFCPYCGHDNPPHYKFCLSCRRRLPDILGQDLPKAGTPAPIGAGSGVGTPPAPADAPPPSGELEPAPRGRPWILLPIAVVIIVVIALVAYQLLPVYLGGHPATKAPPPPGGKILSLCAPENGSNCRGFSFPLPAVVDVHNANTTTCDPIPSLGSAETLWMNYSASSTIYSVVLPAAVFAVSSGGWVEDAFALLQNHTAVASALWFSGLNSGTFSEAIPVPNDGATYCIGWWEPSNAPTTVSWLNDVNISYEP